MSALVDKYTKRFVVEITVDQESELPDSSDLLWVLETYNQGYCPITFKVTDL